MSLAIIAIIVQAPERDIFTTLLNVPMLHLRLIFILKNVSLQSLKKKINYPKQYLYLLIIHVICFNNQISFVLHYHFYRIT